MRQTLLLFFLINGIICNAQSFLAHKGIITLATNELIIFEKIQIIEGQFQYTEPSTGTEKRIPISNVKIIEDENFKRIFTNRSIITSSEFSSEGIVIEKTKADSTITARTSPIVAIKNPVAAPNGCPNGIYYEKEDFINMIPNSVEAIIPKELVGWEKDEINGIPDECYFYTVKDDKRIRKVFAVCYKGHIYFQTQAILEHRNKTDRAQTNHFPNGFTKVKTMGENYYYTEVNLVNKWAQGFAYSGGVVGGAMAGSLYNYKGIVWDVKNKEFNIFKNCSDYNDFIRALYPEGVQVCKNQQPNIAQVREAMEKIK